MPEPLSPGSDEDRWLLDAELIMQATLDKEQISLNLSQEKQTKEETAQKEIVLTEIK